jgi:hypothetical protein
LLSRRSYTARQKSPLPPFRKGVVIKACRLESPLFQRGAGGILNANQFQTTFESGDRNVIQKYLKTYGQVIYVASNPYSSENKTCTGGYKVTAIEKYIIFLIYHFSFQVYLSGVDSEKAGSMEVE